VCAFVCVCEDACVHVKDTVTGGVLTMHGEFLSGGGKRGLLNSSEPC
jgi:hypothetical protein